MNLSLVGFMKGRAKDKRRRLQFSVEGAWGRLPLDNNRPSGYYVENQQERHRVMMHKKAQSSFPWTEKGLGGRVGLPSPPFPQSPCPDNDKEPPSASGARDDAAGFFIS